MHSLILSFGDPQVAFRLPSRHSRLAASIAEVFEGNAVSFFLGVQLFCHGHENIFLQLFT